MTTNSKSTGVEKPDFSAIKWSLGNYLGVENTKRHKVYAEVDKFFGVKNSDGRIKKFGELGFILAGGAINAIYSGRKVKDLDIYLRDTGNLDAVKEYMAECFGAPVYETANALTYRRKGRDGKKLDVQIITRFSGTPREILNTFDFTIVQGSFDFQTETFLLDDNFLPDIASRVLRYTSTSHFPICALIRTKKYQERGYVLVNSTILAISFAINRLDLKTYKNVKEQLLGIDTMFLYGFLETLDDDTELTDTERREFIETCCTLIDNQIGKSFGIGQISDDDSETDE
jgi:hypothetical protein